MSIKYHKYIDSYIEKIKNEKIPACKELKQAIDYIESKLDDPDVYIDSERIDEAVRIIEKYFDFELLDWELFIIALIHVYYKSEDDIVFDEFFIMMGRGNGKNGFISALIFYLSTHYHGIKGYNIDIVANNEDQAKTSFHDVYNILEEKEDKLKHFYYWTKEKITNLKTNSYIQYNTSNARTKDGKRTGCLIFDEIHEYEDYEQIKVFTSGFGKRKHARAFYITTDGYVRGGVLDDFKDMSRRVLDGEIDELGFLPLIWKIDEKEEAENEEMWVKACPSINHFPELRKEMKKEAVKMEYQPHIAQEFLTKRMNMPAEDNFEVVAPWEKIKATNQPVPYEKLEGLECIGALDYARTTDFASCGLLFKYGGKRYWLEHTFVCHLALEMESRQIKFPVKEMEGRGLITIINRDAISANDMAGWFLEKAKTFNIKKIVADRYRYSLVESKFKEEGLPIDDVPSGPATHAKVHPLLEQIFAEETLVFGDNPTMRWYVNNCYTETDKKGNTTYLKIEPKTRKTDGFFALVHALTQDGELQEQNNNVMDFEVYTY
ncbi:MAG: terminase TerL endonuclease subunit [Bacteroidales bacterium]